tara:strand:- start:21514 stop:24501 length:2988 start_codon:yes stop_codon:yes gene_type:complete
VKCKCLNVFIHLTTILFIVFFPANSIAQNNDEGIEVYLSFRHRGIINTTVVAYYKNDTFYLPIDEIFSVLQLDVNTTGITVSGKFSTDQIEYKIDLEKKMISFGDEKTPLSQNDYLIKELDNYLLPEVFDKIFDLQFSVDFNNLTLELVTFQEIPIVQSMIRNQKRRISTENRGEISYYPLRTGREPRFINGGFVDYSLSTFLSNDQFSYSFSNAIGLQLAGGDLGGTFFGTKSENYTNFSSNNLRWRYVLKNNALISKIFVGQSTTDGVLNSAYTGIKLTNEPVVTQKLFDEYEIKGNTIPESEIEVFLNNTLIDFAKADEVGNYRFIAPLYYGSSNIDLKIYGPTGQVIERTSRLQVPFSFTPKGTLIYKFNAGVLDQPIIGNVENLSTIQGNASYGLSNWLSTKVGFEYYESQSSTLTTSLSARLLTSYIVTLENVLDSYFRSTLNAIYPNSTSINFSYTDYANDRGIFNTSGNDKQIVTSIFYPLLILKKIPINIRSSAFTRFRDESSFTTFRVDLGTRIKKLNFRVGYSDRIIDTFNPLNSTPSSFLESSLTYNVDRGQNIPKLLRGAFLRSQFKYQPSQNALLSAEFLVARSITKKGRFQISFGRNFAAEYNTIRFNFVFDLNKVRTNTTMTSIRNSYTTTQNVRGSIGYDTNYNNFLFTSRDQVGKSGAAISLFIDNNNNNKLDEGDEKIEKGTLRIGKSGSSSIVKNGVLYYTQMQSYNQYNMELNTGSISNPMLAPEVEKFSVITDPNSFKKIELPFYMSGVIDGVVERELINGNKTGIGGLKVNIINTSTNELKEIRTYSNGGYYDYPVRPGNYTAYIDNDQLTLLNSKSKPEKIDFTVQAIKEGDFIDGLNFLLVPKDAPDEIIPTEDTEITLSQVTDDIKNDAEIYMLEEQLTENVTLALRMLILAQNAFYNKDINGALANIDQSLEFFKTAQGYALKGSILYFKGDKVEAVKSWRMALRYDPDINIPTLEELDSKVTVSNSE